MEGITKFPFGEYLAVDVKEEKDTNIEENVDHSTITIDELVDSVKKNLSWYTSRDSSPVSIYKVPAKLRRENDEAYTPRLISIGPIHHGRPELQGMERYKWRYLDRYLQTSTISLTEVATISRDMEISVRQCYQESFDNLSSKEFSEMIMLDGVFLVGVLNEDRRRNIENYSKRNGEETRDQEGKTSATGYVSQNQCVSSDIKHDLMLLENQLPLFVVENFYNHIKGFDFESSIYTFFSDVGNLVKAHDKEPEFTSEAENVKTHWERIDSRKGRRHFVDFLRSYYQPVHGSDDHTYRGKNIVYSPSTTELQEAGVKIRGVLRYNIFDIRFQEGELTIPRLRIDEHLGTVLRNLIAFEQCQYEERKDITSYVIFMENLINTSKDVDLLVRYGVIQNFLGDHESVARLFNNVHKESVRGENEFYFEQLCTELNEYRKNYWHQWKAKWFRSKKVLRRDYFNTTWSTLSVVAAVMLLLLTMVQTLCSVVSVLQPK